MKIARWTTVGLTVTAFLAFNASEAVAHGEAAAHGEATLKSPTTSVPAGAALGLRGTGFAPGQAHRLVLRGILDEHDLGEVTAAADSAFTVEISIPDDVRPGQYRVVAIAPDGDEVATLDMPVTAARESAEASDAGHEDARPASSSTPGSEARAEDIRIERSRAGLEWGVIGLLIGLAGGLGLGLMRRV